MAYARMNRTEIEAWLDNSNFAWKRDDRTAGIYFLKLSDEVAIKLSTTLSGLDAAMGRGKASTSMMLVSLVNGRCLNAKAKDRKHFKRTTNWRSTWLAGLRHWEGIFGRCPHFYNRIAHEAPRYRR
jgi:hypothetical protein